MSRCSGGGFSSKFQNSICRLTCGSKIVKAAAQFYKNPPKGWLPASFTPPKTTASAAQSFTFAEAKKTPQ